MSTKRKLIKYLPKEEETPQKKICYSFMDNMKIYFYCRRKTLINSVIVFITIIIQGLFPLVNFFFAATLIKLSIYHSWKNKWKKLNSIKS
jgi:hypothetical protein